MRRRRGRTLDKEEITLWHHVVKSVKPLPGRAIPAIPPDEAPADAGDQSGAESKDIVKATQQLADKLGAKSGGKKTTAKTAPQKPAAPKVPAPKIPPLAPLERRQRLALRRGTEAIEAVLDLHGMRQMEAHAALIGFVRRAQREQKRVVVVVTGKGGGEVGDDLMFGERGVLRRLVPQWLASPELRSVVLGYGEAGRHHGGTGALYVRLRRSRETRP
ncbi:MULTISPECIES: Smr/MutS family protein [unclassified Chelatococcus]|uniref:Smr/MutS family protein n=1 Tax=unclassified Chelatococcus TaxID=2638111 RepID=UPI001BCF93BE|nr:MULTISPECIES: Smr/MutS family protein [unclassified Chelatococcus]CAH1657131.1 DNA-nicking Smr family endonuclease [Hyphomicrobiales bacterium]MBS7740638.1 Smr/MutS family protein [Chelatococcus sp. HY11]MBX3544578.1 Smr/MutS family protein [Chelatococcus sp.]MCO5079875.1 Smr/MutS family protein [Chelatococcus sp.]CAH1684520.1 DNA-nicking Smr family endonuclease [Hyphomicrobiales bacterium]